MPEREARRKSLIEGINKLRADPRTFMGALDPNFDSARTQALQSQLADFEAELGDIETAGQEEETGRFLQFFDEALPPGAQQAQEQSIRDIFGARRTSDVQALNDLFNQQRGTQLDEAAVTGNLRQPGFQASLAQGIDAARQKALGELLSQLSIGESGELLNTSRRAQDLGLQVAGSKAGLASGQNQFGRQLGFQREQFGAGRDLANRQQALDEMFRKNTLAEQIRARNQANKGKDLFDKVGAGFDLTKKFLDVGKAGTEAFGGGEEKQEALKKFGPKLLSGGLA